MGASTPPPDRLSIATEPDPPLSLSALKAKFLDSLPFRSTSAQSLRDAVLGLHSLGVSRPTLVRWMGEAGYSEGYARSFLSRLFRSLGLCLRNPGAGRKTDPAALELLDTLREQHGRAGARKLLRAALRADRADAESSSATVSAIVTPQLAQGEGPYCRYAIIAGQQPPSRRRLSVHIHAQPTHPFPVITQSDRQNENPRSPLFAPRRPCL